MLTLEQQEQVNVECAREAEWWGQLPDATKALNRYPVALLQRDRVRELEAEVARLRPIVEAACAYRPRIGNIEDLEVDPSAVGYERWRLMAELVKAIDAYRATEAVT